MGIYSETTNNTPVDLTLETVDTCCHDCSHPCPGVNPLIYDDFEMELDFYEGIDIAKMGLNIMHVSYQLTSIFDSKGYRGVNFNWLKHGNVLDPGLVMVGRETFKFVEDMEKWGFNVIVELDPYKPYRRHVFLLKNGEIINPLKCIPYFHRLRRL